MSIPTVSKTNRHERGLAIKLALAFVAIYVIWGSTYLAIRYAVETIPPLVAAGLRHSVAGAIMLGWAWLRGYRTTRKEWMAGLVLGAFFFLIGHGSLHWAEQYVGSGLAALLIATEPMFILVLGWMMGRQKISRTSALGLALGVAGVAALTGVELSVKGSSLVGVLAILLGSLSWSFGVVISPKLKLPSERIGANGATNDLRGGNALDCRRLDGRISADAVVNDIAAFHIRTWVSDHVRIGGGVHLLYLAVAAGSANAGGNAYLREPNCCSSAGMARGARAIDHASGAVVGGDSGSDRSDPAG